jgi:hypothetical protein
VLCYHQPGNVAAVFDYTGGCGLNYHVRRDWAHAGGHEASGFFIFHEAHAAGPEGLQFRVVAKPGDFYVILVGSI